MSRGEIELKIVYICFPWNELHWKSIRHELQSCAVVCRLPLLPRPFALATIHRQSERIQFPIGDVLLEIYDVLAPSLAKFVDVCRHRHRQLVVFAPPSESDAFYTAAMPPPPPPLERLLFSLSCSSSSTGGGGEVCSQLDSMIVTQNHRSNISSRSARSLARNFG